MPATTERSSILKYTQHDLLENINELQFLTDDAITKLKKIGRDPVSNTAREHLRGIQSQLLHLSSEVTQSTEEAALRTYIKEELLIRATFRREILTTTGAVAGADWQSPSISHTTTSQAGRRSGKIKLAYNDYTRDQNPDAGLYEQAFLKEYIQGLWKFPVHVLTTSSGMAGFTTILMFLLTEKKLDGLVLVGSSTYFESKELLRVLLGDRYIEVNDANTAEVLSAIRTYQPIACFFDSLGNTHDMTMPNLPVINAAVRAIRRPEVYLVIDNTAVSIMYQPLDSMTGIGTNTRLIIWESLNKFHQFGMDRVTGGIIWALGKHTEKLLDYRGHSGTTLSDIHALSLPTPNRTLLENRLKRMNRNADQLARHIQECIVKNPEGPITQIHYPGLPSHASHAYAKSIGFSGVYLMLTPNTRHASVGKQQSWINNVLRIARKRSVSMVEGTSFGMTPTRIYLTAVRSRVTKPFLRISAGTETALEIEDIKAVFTDALTYS